MNEKPRTTAIYQPKRLIADRLALLVDEESGGIRRKWLEHGDDVATLRARARRICSRPAPRVGRRHLPRDWNLRLEEKQARRLPQSLAHAYQRPGAAITSRWRRSSDARRYRGGRASQRALDANQSQDGRAPSPKRHVATAGSARRQLRLARASLRDRAVLFAASDIDASTTLRSAQGQ